MNYVATYLRKQNINKRKSNLKKANNKDEYKLIKHETKNNRENEAYVNPQHINKIGKFLARLILRKAEREREHTMPISGTQEKITLTIFSNIKWIIKEYIEQHYANNLATDKIDKFLERLKLPKLT